MPSIRNLLFGGLLFLVMSGNAESESTSYGQIVKTWCRHINSWGLDSLRMIYGDTVLYYGAEVSVERCLADKTTYMKPFDDFYLHTPKSFSVVQQTEHIYRCDFIKKYRYKGKTYSYPSYLLIFDDGYNQEIIGESDLVTDRNLAFRIEKSTFLNRTETKKARIPVWMILLWVVGGLLSLTLVYLGIYKKRSLAFSVISEPAQETVPGKLTPSSDPNIAENKQPADRRENNLENIAKGRDFESFVVKKFLPQYFTVSEWTSDKSIDGIYPLSNSNPDLVCEFQLREFKRRFAIECKYRQNPKDVVQVAKPEQLTRYKAFAIERGIPVYIALGIGGTPHNPKELYLIPLEDCKSEMTYEELRNYSRSVKDIWFYNRERDRLT